MPKVPLFLQSTEWNCGPACVQMLLASQGKRISQKKIAKLAKTTRNGTHHKHLVNAIKRFHINARAKKTNFRELKSKLAHGSHAIVNYFLQADNEGHFAVAVAKGKTYITLNDPWLGRKRYSVRKFKQIWFDPDDKTRNLAIFVEANQNFQ